MNAPKSSSNSRQRLLVLTTLAALVLAACDKAPQAPAAAPVPDAPLAAQPMPPAAPVARAPAAPVRSAAPAPQVAAEPYQERPQAVYTEYRAPISQPAPIAVPWAPPPMRVEEVPPQPSPDASWAGGYWVWRDGWVWAPGYWATPPRPRYHWVPPYYEHRQDRVVFVDGFWSPPGVGFVRPAAGVTIALAVIGAAVAVGHAPVGPEGVFVPPPPGSRPGLLVPAPIGTAPAVVVRAPAIIAPGMRVSTTVNRIDNSVHNNVRNDVRNTTINNNRNTTVVNNINNVTIEAPAATTANHQAVRVDVPSQPHLAAAMATRETAPQAQQPQPQPQRPQPQLQTQPPARHVEPARQVDARPADENAMKRALPVNRSAAPAQGIAPPMHAERAAAPEPRRAAEPAPSPAQPHTPPAQAARPAPPVAPEHRPPAQERAVRPPTPAAQPVHNASPPHPAAEKARPNEADQHKPGGERRDEGARKERESR